MNFLTFISLFVSTFMSFNFVSSSSVYNSHCASIVPPSIPNNKFTSFSSSPFGQLHTGYFTGSDTILGLASSWFQNSFSLQTHHIYTTQIPGVFNLEATLSLKRSNLFYYGNSSHRGRGKVVTKLDGFWSESSGNLCMVGKGNGYSQNGNFIRFDAVFKLTGVVNSSDVTSIVHGSLESLSSADDHESYFEPISVLMLPKKNYKYSLDSKEAESDFSSALSDSHEDLSSSIDPSSFCSEHVLLEIRRLNLEYSRDCVVNSSKSCNPIGGVKVKGGSSLPYAVSLNEIECSSHDKKPRFRVLVGFRDDGYYNGSYEATPMFVGEGWWDEKKNQLCVVACHFMGVTTSSSSSLSGVHVGDCSIRLRLRFPSILSIQDTNTVVGQIWSNKTVKDSGYFNKIKVRNFGDFGNSKVVFQGLKYEYTQLEKAEKSCPSKHNNQVKSQEKRYPDAYNSYYLRSDMSVRDSNKMIGWGYSTPLAVGDEFYNSNQYNGDFDNLNNSIIFNVSYEITIYLYSTSMLDDKKSLFNMSSETVRISAEGTYDAETGNLCMIGCRNLVSNNREDSKDCEILVKFEFPPLDATRGSKIKGSIESMRKISHPLYFKYLNLSSNSYYTQGADTAWRMDMEIIMVLISTTLACVFVGSQLFHVKKHPNLIPFISLTMLSILTLGHMVPLVLNFEALFVQNPHKKNFVLGSVGWLRLEVNETTTRLFTMVVFLLLFRLLQITWSARNRDEKCHKSLWVDEKKAVCVTLPLYALGFLIALFLKSKNNNEASSLGQPSSHLEGLKHYGGLILDGFLLPQIMLNLFSNAKEKGLCWSFYLGTSVVRMLPHAYDLYRAHNYVEDDYYGSYYYADPAADFYSTAWDIVIPLGGLLFAVIIFFQQRFGGRCVFPCRFKDSEYEKVPVELSKEEEEEGGGAKIEINNI